MTTWDGVRMRFSHEGTARELKVSKYYAMQRMNNATESEVWLKAVSAVSPGPS